MAGTTIKQRTEGSQFRTTSRKDKEHGERQTGAAYEGTGEVAEQEIPAGAIPLRYSTGRTIGTGTYAFARVECGVMVYADPRDNAEEECFDMCKAIVEEIIERECATLRDADRPQMGLERIPQAYGMQVWLQYGLTIPLKRYESAKTDIGRTIAIGDSAHISDEVAKLQKWIEERIVDVRDRIVGGSEGADMGI